MLAPHADDETLGCGGLLAKAKSCGASTFVMVVSVGDLKHYAHGGEITTGASREKELKKALRILRVDDHVVLFKDSERYMRLDAVPLRDLTEALEENPVIGVNTLKPTIVVLPHPSSNQDHAAVFHAGLTACRPHLPGKKWMPPIVLVCEIPQSYWGNADFNPDFYVDITDTLALKIKAYACHASQVPPKPHPASLEGVRKLAEMRGAQISRAAAEAFECRRFIL